MWKCWFEKHTLLTCFQFFKVLFFKTQISQNRKSGDKKHSAGSNLCFICPKIMKFYSNLYFVILKNLCMPNMSYLRFFIFVGWKRVNWDYPLMPRFFKKRCFVLKGVLMKACGKKCPLLSSSAPWKTLDWATPKKYIFCSPHISRLFCKKFIHVSLWLF